MSITTEYLYLHRDDGGGYPHYDMPYSGGGGGGGHMHRGGHHGGPNWGPGPEMSNIQHQPQEGGPFNNQQGQRLVLINTLLVIYWSFTVL